MEDEFKWMEEITPYITMEPMTLYYNPKGGEFGKFIERINPLHTELIKWTFDLRESNLNYIVLNENMRVVGWCDGYTYEGYAKEMYSNYHHINLDEYIIW